MKPRVYKVKRQCLTTNRACQMIVYNPMASDKGVNEVCSLIKDVQCASHCDIIKLVKMELFFKIKKVCKED